MAKISVNTIRTMLLAEIKEVNVAVSNLSKEADNIGRGTSDFNYATDRNAILRMNKTLQDILIRFRQIKKTLKSYEKQFSIWLRDQ